MWEYRFRDCFWYFFIGGVNGIIISVAVCRSRHSLSRGLKAVDHDGACFREVFAKENTFSFSYPPPCELVDTVWKFVFSRRLREWTSA